ncbi:Aminoglycoside phosphotransferase [Metarhizium album ARSEF 1941]|uniref:Aminoglycoside phosphotransferase n=1 Tax=Metarhizium album (strain ARSEF 1941) TaxID=1081103 RepID=A0A0B2X7Q7_METAS|nr:Aminoglycoside phosphotransferase [Metarhizium album ARSEF 1941]KHO01311.1 Aminoglycoside phosphotransferase [Metarhizium album ARSEF 1941]
MAPGKSLPPAIDPSLIATLLTFLALPPARSITPLHVNAAFHRIYLIHYASPPPAAELADLWASPAGTRLVLRVSGPHVPYLKTTNEVAIMTWVRRNTRIPVPRVVRYDNTPNNVLGREFTLLEEAPGRSVDSVYAHLPDATKVRLVNELIDALVELRAHPFRHVGGLQLVGDEVLPGPLLEDAFWFRPGMEAEFGSDESVQTPGPVGPYSSHADFVRGYIGVVAHAVAAHDALAWARHLLPRLAGLVAALPRLELDTALVLAHKDLHFGNVMASPDGRVTAILDWEFAAVVPVVRWDPVCAFLWNCEYTQEGHDEKYRMRAVFERELERRGVVKWWQATSPDIDAVWDVVRYMRAIVELCPRGGNMDQCRLWSRQAAEALAKLGV